MVENAERRHLRPGLPRHAASKINDELFLTPGRRPRLGQVAVDAGGALDRGHRGGLRAAGPVMPDTYDGSAAGDRAAARQNIATRGSWSAAWSRNDFKSSDDHRAAARRGPATGQRIDYRALSQAVEQNAARQVRDRADGKPPTVRHVIGFAKLVGDADRRPAAGRCCTSASRDPDRGRDHVLVHALRALAPRCRAGRAR
ncbi:MAG: hypothetical protein MZU91_12060 [Desulfosudis oleivorans]|nr:hypothetical protein [Desulfosudis oleivorans]